jgi:hypothetical protein
MTQEGKQFKRTEDGHLILMSQEERKLLITDLTSRIDYGVICMIERVDDFGSRWRNEKLTGFVNEEDGCFYFDFGYGLTVEFAEKVKPYLRPMSSMTEEEQKELEKIIDGILGYKARNYFHSEDDYKWNTLYEAIDWLNKHHFDYRGLIEKGLALEAPKGMYER